MSLAAAAAVPKSGARSSAPTDEPTRPLIRQLPARNDALWALGRQVADLVIAYVDDDTIPVGAL